MSRDPGDDPVRRRRRAAARRRWPKPAPPPPRARSCGFDIGGSIGIDLPTLPPRPAARPPRRSSTRLLPQPFERTAVNGFGFLQIVRRRTRPSIPELLRADPAGAAARALLRRAERLSGAVAIGAAPRGDCDPGRPAHRARAGAATAARPRLRAEPGLAISAGACPAQPSLTPARLCGGADRWPRTSRSARRAARTATC